MNTEQILDAYGASVTSARGALQISGMVAGYLETRTYYYYGLTEATDQWLREFGHEVTCRYCGTETVEAEFMQFCTECAEGHEDRFLDATAKLTERKSQ